MPISAYPWHRSGYLQGTCTPLTLLRIPAGHLHTPDTALDTCRALAYPCHCSGYLQGTCIPLPLLRIPAGCLHTPDTARDTCRELAYPRHLSGYQRRRIDQTTKALTCSYYVGIQLTARCNRWILTISRRVSLTVTLELAILTSYNTPESNSMLYSLRITVTSGLRLVQTVMAYRSHLDLSTMLFMVPLPRHHLVVFCRH